MNATGTITRQLPSHRRELEHLHVYLDDLRAQSMVPQEVYERMEVCLHEAVLNAIVHGNKEQETRIVEVVLGWQDSTWTLEVRDEGSGFDPNAVVDPTAQENLLRTHGRGLYLMRELSDGIWFTDHARTVRMSFRPRNPPPSI